MRRQKKNKAYKIDYYYFFDDGHFIYQLFYNLYQRKNSAGGNFFIHWSAINTPTTLPSFKIIKLAAII
jgi:hypothetical protein